MSKHTTLPDYPTEITLETLPQLFAAHRARFGGMTMEGPDDTGGPVDPPARPDDVPETEWDALGDPGRALIVRERDARRAAERALAAARARPAPPKQPAADTSKAGTGDPKTPSVPEGTDLAQIINDAVAAAVKPFADRDAQRDADAAAQAITSTVLKAAETKFVDPTDALSGIDLTKVTDGNGAADDEKVAAELDALLVRKPHLGKVIDPRRQAPPGSAAGAGGSAVPLETRVQETLAQMQAAAGIRATKP